VENCAKQAKTGHNSAKLRLHSKTRKTVQNRPKMGKIVQNYDYIVKLGKLCKTSQNRAK